MWRRASDRMRVSNRKPSRVDKYMSNVTVGHNITSIGNKIQPLESDPRQGLEGTRKNHEMVSVRVRSSSQKEPRTEISNICGEEKREYQESLSLPSPHVHPEETKT